MGTRWIEQLRGSLALDDGTPDADLLRRCSQEQDSSAFESLVRRHANLVWRICRCHNPHDSHAAEDAFQATFLALLRQARSIRGNLPAWLHTVARRVSTRLRQNPTHPYEDRAIASVYDAEQAETSAIVAGEIAALREAERVPLIMIIYGGLTHAEVATELGLPIGTVASRLARAKARLESRLVRRGVAPTIAAITWGASDRVVAQTIAMATTPAPLAIQSLTTGALTAMQLAKLKLIAAVLFVIGGVGTVIGMAQTAPDASPNAAAPKVVVDLSAPDATIYPMVKPDREDLPWLTGEKKFEQRPNEVAYQLLIAQLESKKVVFAEFSRIVRAGAARRLFDQLSGIELNLQQYQEVMQSLAELNRLPKETAEEMATELVRFAKGFEEIARRQYQASVITAGQMAACRVSRLRAEWVLHRIQNGQKPLR